MLSTIICRNDNNYMSGINITSPPVSVPASFFSKRIIARAKEAMMRPWPASPNITANRKGKVMMVYGARE